MHGRTTRLIAFVPLLMHGYPPIAVSLAERSSYFDAINQVCRHLRFDHCVVPALDLTIDSAVTVQAYFSDFRPLVKCFVKGMQEGIDMARALNQST